MMLRRFAWIGASVLLIGIVLSCLPPSPAKVNRQLASRSIPPVPSPLRVKGHNAGGLLAEWYFTALEVDASSITQYEELLRKDGASEFDVESGPGEVVVIRSVDKPPYEELMNSEVRFKPKVNGRYLGWWNTDAIEEGKCFEKILPGASRYQVFTDHARNLIYVYWSYS